MAFDTMNETDDETLLALYGDGDQASARALMARHAPRILALATRMLKDRTEAEDVTQETMLRLWKIAPDWRTGEAKISTWLYRVASNLCMDRLRKKRGVGLDQVPEAADNAPDVEEKMMMTSRSTALKAAMDRLPDRQKLALSLRHLQELSNPEIASIMDASVEAVESLLSRGRRTLAAELQKHRPALGLVQE